jgi:hypothetical protein
MDIYLLDLIAEEWPDWEEWIGELFIQWDDVAAKRRKQRSDAGRWEVLKREVARIRREVRNEGRGSRMIYLENMDDLLP